MAQLALPVAAEMRDIARIAHQEMAAIDVARYVEFLTSDIQDKACGGQFATHIEGNTDVMHTVRDVFRKQGFKCKMETFRADTYLALLSISWK